MKTNTVRIRVGYASGGSRKTFPVLDGNRIISGSRFIVSINGTERACVANTERQKVIGTTIIVLGVFQTCTGTKEFQIQEGMEVFPI
ncbi:hypothetical protein ACFL08_01815 [Patescibacteria group bacterium]